MSVSAVGRLLRTTNQQLWRVIYHYVMAAHQRKDWSKVRDPDGRTDETPRKPASRRFGGRMQLGKPAPVVARAT